MRKKKIHGYASFVNSEQLVFQMHLIRTGKDSYEWIDYRYRGHLTFQNGIPVGSTKLDGCFPAGKPCKVHCKRMRGSGSDFDRYVMEKLSATYDDVETLIAKGVAQMLPIVEK